MEACHSAKAGWKLGFSAPGPRLGGLAQSVGPGALGGLLRLLLPEQTMGRVRQAPGLAFGHISSQRPLLTGEAGPQLSQGRRVGDQAVVRDGARSVTIWGSVRGQVPSGELGLIPRRAQ